ncbi:MAG: uracil-DNA glycosylase family protein [Candidatus Aenigmatarchaeota archaeon]
MNSQLEALKTQIIACKDCIGTQREKVAFEPITSHSPDLFIIGKHPALDEIYTKRPFTGPSGTLLRKMLKTYNLNSIFLTNAIKCYPPPTHKKEILNCIHKFLFHELELIKPKVIVILSNDIAKLAFNIEHHGYYGKTPAFAFPNPAALLENKNFCNTLIFETFLQLISKILTKNISSEEILDTYRRNWYKFFKKKVTTFFSSKTEHNKNKTSYKLGLNKKEENSLFLFSFGEGKKEKEKKNSYYDSNQCKTNVSPDLIPIPKRSLTLECDFKNEVLKRAKNLSCRDSDAFSSEKKSPKNTLILALELKKFWEGIC